MTKRHASGRLACGVLALATSVSLFAGVARFAVSKFTVSWLGNSFSGADGKWVQNFFIHANARPDGSVITWSHWDEGASDSASTRMAT